MDRTPAAAQSNQTKRPGTNTAIMKKNPSVAEILPAWIETVATAGRAFRNINPITVKVKQKSTVAATMVSMDEDKAGDELTPRGWNRKVMRAKAASKAWTANIFPNLKGQFSVLPLVVVAVVSTGS